ncbi:MAG: aldo/keto reductase [Gaiellaceae bacterium]|jgi:aryl-alcohol dehydrogenase-like predicted oxidoreductase
MERRQLGASPVEVSRLVLGCGNFGGVGSAPEFFGQGESEEEAFELMDAAWSLGMRTFDTADAYGGGRSEQWIGNWIASTGNRPVIVTKTYNPMAEGADHGLARARITRQLESSLDRLGVDSIDVYLAHEFDPDAPLADMVATFEGLRDIGLVNAWGVSNFDATQLRALYEHGAPSVVQNAYNLLERADEHDVIGLCTELGIAYMAFGPLAGGLLAGRYRSGDDRPAGSRLSLRPGPYEHLLGEETFAGLQRFAGAAEERGVQSATLALAWLLQQPGVTAVVVGPRNQRHLGVALRALDVNLSPAEADAFAQLF